MNISKVTSNTSSGITTKQDSIIDALQKRKEELSAQLAEVKNSKQDNKIKAEKIKNITTQIADIQQQIVQAQAAAKQREMEDAQQKAADNAQTKQDNQAASNTNTPGAVLSPSLNKLLSATKNSTDYKTMHAVQQKLKGEMAVAHSQIKNSHMGATQSQINIISNNSAKITELGNKMAQKIEEGHKNLQKSITLGIKESEKTRENGEEEIQGNQKTDNTAASIDTASSSTVPESQQAATTNEESTSLTSVDVLV